MSPVLNVVLPVFAIILSGYLAGRARLLGESSSEALNRFVYWMALPALLFAGTARKPLAELFNGPFIGAFLGAMLLVYALGAVLGRVLHRERSQIQCMQGLTACFSNTGYMGIPLFLAAFGADRLAPAIIATVIMSAVMVGIAVIWLELVQSHGQGWGRAVRDVGRAVSRNPLIVSSVAGSAWALLLPGVDLPQPVVTFCDLVGSAAGPCALVAIGLFLSTRRVSADPKEIAWIVGLKLLVQPVLTWVLIRTVFPLDPYWADAAILLAALPTGALTFVVAQQYRIYVDRTSTAILVSTVVSVVTLSVLLSGMAP